MPRRFKRRLYRLFKISFPEDSGFSSFIRMYLSNEERIKKAVRWIEKAPKMSKAYTRVN